MTRPAPRPGTIQTGTPESFGYTRAPHADGKRVNGAIWAWAWEAPNGLIRSFNTPRPILRRVVLADRTPEFPTFRGGSEPA